MLGNESRKLDPLFGLGMTGVVHHQIIMVSQFPARFAAGIERWIALGALAVQRQQPESFLGFVRRLKAARDDPLLENFFAKLDEFASRSSCRRGLDFLNPFLDLRKGSHVSPFCARKGIDSEMLVWMPSLRGPMPSARPSNCVKYKMRTFVFLPKRFSARI